jgi:hypothetical protein
MTMWTTKALQEDYEVLGFGYGVCIVKRRSDGVKGTLDFGVVDGSRHYFNFVEAS